jgi:hypothetical protein
MVTSVGNLILLRDFMTEYQGFQPMYDRYLVSLSSF